MNREKLAKKLVESSLAERKFLLAENSAVCDVKLALALQNICYEVWTSQPKKVLGIVSALDLLTKQTRNKEIEAILEWTKAIKNLVGGNLEKCLAWLDKSENSFKKLNKNHAAATTQISKLYALALLGRYDEAVKCGLKAREVFLSENDIYSVGKIEHNIGNLYWRRDFYAESEPFLASAYQHFSQIDDQRQMAMVENTQAFVKSLQNDFLAAEKIYAKAINRAEKNSFTVTQAEIETGLSNLYLFQGKLDFALKFMERSRRKYETLQMPAPTANCELELADIYLELNLLQEALELYETAARKFTELGMQAELARCSMNSARTHLFSGEINEARLQIEKAETLFCAEGNLVATASAQVFKSQIFFLENDFATAENLAEHALKVFADNKNLRFELFARWLLGEIALAKNDLEKASQIFEKTLSDAKDNSSSIENLCLIALGKIALKKGKRIDAETFFRRAVELTENTRSTLEAEEFRMAFLGDKIFPFLEIAKIKLAENDFAQAFQWLERSRSRSLLDAIGTPSVPLDSDQSDNLKIATEIENLRGELNWFYSRLNRNSTSGLEARKNLNSLKKEVFEREKKLTELERRLPKDSGTNFDFEIENLQSLLGDSVLIEYAVFDGKISAFAINRNEINFCENIADEKAVNEEIEQFLFQIKTARFIDKLSKSNQKLALSRVLRHSRKLYDLLVKPFEKFIKSEPSAVAGGLTLQTKNSNINKSGSQIKFQPPATAGGSDKSKIVFVPANRLHYLPFHALSDGENFLIEKHEVSYAPSAAVLANCLQKPDANFDSALLIAFADEIIPNAEREVEKIAELLPNSVQIIGNKATLRNIQKLAKDANLLHFACHAKFRPDNPLFSALNLSGENLVVRDARKIDLQNKLVVLSACETGLSKIESGEEILGLSRGFLSAGAKNLVLSFWTVNDDSTLLLMSDFYKNLQNGKTPGESLRLAQIKNLEKHPYFWSPFFLVGG